MNFTALPYLVYRDTPEIGGAELIAGFVKKVDAYEYADLIRNENRTAGYNDRFFVKEDK